MITAGDVRAWLLTAIEKYPDQGLGILPGLEDEYFWPMREDEFRSNKKRMLMIHSDIPGKKPRISVLTVWSHPRELEALKRGLDKALAALLALPIVDMDDTVMSLKDFRDELLRRPEYAVPEDSAVTSVTAG